jgi:hypothetical protein
MEHQHDDLIDDADELENPSAADTALVLSNPDGGVLDGILGKGNGKGVVGIVKGGLRTLTGAIPAGGGFVGANYIREMASLPLIERLPADWQGRTASLVVDSGIQIFAAGLAKRMLGKKVGPGVATGIVVNTILHIIASLLGPESDIPVDLVALPMDVEGLPGEPGAEGEPPMYEEPPMEGIGRGARPIPVVGRIYAPRDTVGRIYATR